MELVDRALLERVRGRGETSTALFREALDSELSAIDSLPEKRGLGWSILYRSAATMALDCEDFRMAEKLASTALAGDPHPQIAGELRDVWERANFHRHLEYERVELGNVEVQLSLVGAAAAGGMASLPDLLSRVDSFQKLVFRTAQRRIDGEYTSRVPNKVTNGYRAFAAAPTAGSFAIGIRLAHSGDQPSFPGMLGTEEIVTELMDLLEYANESRTDEIAERIPDLHFRQNFLGLSKKLAPDGRRIRQVGFTSVNGAGVRTLSVTTPASDFLSPRREPRGPDTSVVTVSGLLRLADASGRKIRLHGKNDSKHDVLVPRGLMDDIVRPMWNSHVTVRGSLRGKQKLIRLFEIWESDPDLGTEERSGSAITDTSGGLQERLW